ncbi:MAG: pitrilysin family protein [Actinomycetota bacterium]|nr:pitrilysin family protein [Actinomycetota bacterium]
MTIETSESIRRTDLDNGLQVVTEWMPQAHSVAAGIWVSIGSRDEPAPLAGVSHFLEHLMFKGTVNHDARSIAVAVDSCGGEFNAYTAKEYTAFYTRVPADRFDLGVELLTEVVSAPALRHEEIEAERQVILEELLMNEDAPDDVVHSILFEALFPDHPLGWEVLGTMKTLEKISAADIAGFFSQWYGPKNLVVSAAGPVEHDRVVEAAQRRFGHVTTARVAERTEPIVTPKPLVTDSRATEQTHLALGWRGPGLHDDRRFAFGVLNHVLGGGLSSRLFQQIREERGLAYSVYSAMSSYSDAGALTVYAGTAPQRAREVLSIIDDVCGALATDGVSDEELAIAQGYLAGSTVLGLEDTGSRMARLAGSMTTRGEVLAIEEYLRKLRAVTSDDVREIAAEVLSNQRTLAAVGPMGDHPVA